MTENTEYTYREVTKTYEYPNHLFTPKTGQALCDLFNGYDGQGYRCPDGYFYEVELHKTGKVAIKVYDTGFLGYL